LIPALRLNPRTEAERAAKACLYPLQILCDARFATAFLAFPPFWQEDGKLKEEELHVIAISVLVTSTFVDE
jgi:hypothetical protein